MAIFKGGQKAGEITLDKVLAAQAEGPEFNSQVDMTAGACNHSTGRRGRDEKTIGQLV